MNVIVMDRTDFSLSFIKEPKEEEMTEEEKAAQKARPIATNPIPGTPWYAHHITAHTVLPRHFIATNQMICFFLLTSTCVCVFQFIPGVWYGRVTIACSSTTQQHGCPCGTGPRSWWVELMLTSTSKSRHTREAWRTARRQVWTNTDSHTVSDYEIERSNFD